MPEVKTVDILVKPSISKVIPEEIEDDFYLEQGYFSDITEQFEVTICVGEYGITYGKCPLVYYYRDIYEEIAKLRTFRSHEIEMSGYTVASIKIDNRRTAQITVYDTNDFGGFTEHTESIDLDAFLTQLRITKASIEYLALGKRKTHDRSDKLR
jgi:hypothetical protein